MTAIMTTTRTGVLPEVAEQHREYQRRLQDDRAFRLDQLAELERESRTSARPCGVNSALRIAATTALREIDDALDRIAAGSYGVCVGCHATIPAERLDALPMTSLCTACHFNEQNCRVSRRLAPPA